MVTDIMLENQRDHGNLLSFSLWEWVMNAMSFFAAGLTLVAIVGTVFWWGVRLGVGL